MKRIYKITITDIPKVTTELASQLKGGEILALIGPLGAGKTTFTKALAKELGFRGHVTSPTFVFINSFPVRLKNAKITFHHLDLYRAKSVQEIWSLGLKEFWGKKDSITVIEWADKIERFLPPKTCYIYLRHIKIID